MLDKKKKVEQEDLFVESQEPDENIAEITETVAEVTKESLYSHRKWKGVNDVFICRQCDYQVNDEDTMKLHVLNHYPEQDRNKILDLLVGKDK